MNQKKWHQFVYFKQEVTKNIKALVQNQQEKHKHSNIKNVNLKPQVQIWERAQHPTPSVTCYLIAPFAFVDQNHLLMGPIRLSHLAVYTVGNSSSEILDTYDQMLPQECSHYLDQMTTCKIHLFMGHILQMSVTKYSQVIHKSLGLHAFTQIKRT